MNLSDETNNANEHNMVYRNSNWPEVDQLALYKHDRGVELGGVANCPSKTLGLAKF